MANSPRKPSRQGTPTAYATNVSGEAVERATQIDRAGDEEDTNADGHQHAAIRKARKTETRAYSESSGVISTKYPNGQWMCMRMDCWVVQAGAGSSLKSNSTMRGLSARPSWSPPAEALDVEAP